MNRQRLDYLVRCDLDRYLEQHSKLKEIYYFKEKLQQLYRTKGYNRAQWAFKNLIEELSKSEHEELKDCVERSRPGKARCWNTSDASLPMPLPNR